MDYYKTLGLKFDSSRKEIVSKYKEILNQFPPSSFENQKTANQFKLIYKAYYILSDDFRRENYNKYYQKNDFESVEFKIWHKNQFKKMRTQTDNSKYDSASLVVDIVGDAAFYEIFGVTFELIGEVIGSVFEGIEV